MLRPLRAQAMAELAALMTARRPALRRSDAADALLATDLATFAPEAAERFTRRMEALGWSVRCRSGWLLLDVPVPAPPLCLPAAAPGEIGCCLSLLMRHREERAPAEACIRAVVKAADAGRLPLERLCGELHRQFAASLREGRSLPGALLPYLCRALEVTKEAAR